MIAAAMRLASLVLDSIRGGIDQKSATLRNVMH